MKKNYDLPAYPEHPPVPNGLSAEEYGLNYGAKGVTQLELASFKMMAAYRIAFRDSKAESLAKEAIKDAKELLNQLDNEKE